MSCVEIMCLTFCMAIFIGISLQPIVFQTFIYSSAPFTILYGIVCLHFMWLCGQGIHNIRVCINRPQYPVATEGSSVSVDGCHLFLCLFHSYILSLSISVLLYSLQSPALQASHQTFSWKMCRKQTCHPQKPSTKFII